MSQTGSREAEIVAAHERRLPTLDPLLPNTHPLPGREPADLTLFADGAVALLRRERPDPESFVATWGAADQHRLITRVGGTDPAAAMDALLDRCRDQVLPRVDPHDPDSEVGLSWPSRDPVMTRVFLAHGLVPAAVIAARLTGRPSPGSGNEHQVRSLAASDLDAATGLWMEEVRWDAQFGSVTERPSSASAIRHQLTERVSRDQPWTWIAESSGRAQGLLVVTPPEQADWIAPLTNLSPVAYVTCLVVSARARGTGVGAALVRQAHAAIEAAGVAVTLLHYAALNPLSGPFWHRSGYRPLWTIWHAQPAARLC